MKVKNSFHTYAVITIIFWSLAYVFTRLALQHFSSFSLGFLRYFIASCTLIVIAIVTKMKLPKVKDLPIFLLAGIFGFFFYMIAFNQGQKTVTASTASTIISIAPVLTALIARLVYKEKMNLLKWVAVVVEFLGVIILALMNSGLSVNSGVIWLFMASLSLSLYNILQRKLTKEYTAIQTSAFSIFAGTILLALFIPDSIQEVSSAPPMQWFYVMVLGVFSSAIAYISWAKAFEKAEQTSQVSNYMFVTPFLTSVLGFLIAGEVPDSATLIGGGIILLGIFIFNFGENMYKSLCNSHS